MDGDSDGPAGKTAENWSRRDGIRAGSVSGPWRSVARADSPDVASDPVPDDLAPQPRALPRQPVRRPLPVALWIGLGLLVAVSLVLTALFLRPDPTLVAGAPVAETVEPAATPEPEPDALPAEPDAVAEPADPALGAVGSVRVRLGEGFPDERRDTIVAALEAGGIADVQVEVLPFAIATSRVGYYLGPDRAAAEALARLAAPAAGGSLAVRDYGKLLDDPESGRLDLWIAD